MEFRELIEGVALLVSIAFYLESRARSKQVSHFMREAEAVWAAGMAERREAMEFREYCVEAAMRHGASRTAVEAQMPQMQPPRRHLKLVD